MQLALAGSAPLALRKPVVYQIVTGKRKEIAGRYRLIGNRVRLSLGAYDHTQTQVIDAVLDYLTYPGGGGGATSIGAPQTACAQCNQQKRGELPARVRDWLVGHHQGHKFLEYESWPCRDIQRDCQQYPSHFARRHQREDQRKSRFCSRSAQRPGGRRFHHRYRAGRGQ